MNNKMKNEQILKKAIEKAVKNGYKEPRLKLTEEERLTILFGVDNKIPFYYTMILSHDFAKAFWGEELNGWPPMNWESHLQQMVITEEPLKYIEKFL